MDGMNMNERIGEVALWNEKHVRSIIQAATTSGRRKSEAMSDSGE